MNRLCQKCNSKIPKNIIVDGKKRNLQRRKYCLDCSPFGIHNTRKLECELDGDSKICPDCKEKHDQKGKRCFRCYFQKRQKEICKKVDSIVGTECWLCGYTGCRRNLCFHHLDPNTKQFSLTTRELMLKWDRVFAEMQKCALVCANCHGEIHEGLIPEEKVIKIWKEKWNEKE